MRRSLVKSMSLEQLCIEQEEQIERQSKVIKDLLMQVIQLKNLVNEMMDAEDDNK